MNIRPTQRIDFFIHTLNFTNRSNIAKYLKITLSYTGTRKGIAETGTWESWDKPPTLFDLYFKKTLLDAACLLRE